jgi:hypothetical protein
MAALFLWLNFASGSPKTAFLFFAILSTLLYPYSRFAYETIINFIVGNNIFISNAIVFLGWKIFTMIMCWACAIFIAPIGLLFIYFYQRKGND